MHDQATSSAATDGTVGTVGIIGAGTMGAGIAQVAALGGWRVLLHDINEGTTKAAIAAIGGFIDRLVTKQRITADRAAATKDRIEVAAAPIDLAPSDLLIEAISEDMDLQVRVLAGVLAHLPDEAIIATNTSSLSVGDLGQAIGAPARTVGMHFFNPAPLMKLVEVIAGHGTDPAVADRVAGIAESWGKVVARAADVPGFIVNHVARPYYLEAFRILDAGLAAPETIDAAMTERAGFRMGPLALTDLIGQDVNTATTRSVWERLDPPPLLRPSELQERLVSEGHLGRKSGRGVYTYDDDGAITGLGLVIDVRSVGLDDRAMAAAADFAEAATGSPASPVHGDVGDLAITRILAALIEQARLAVDRGVASPADVDTALKFGVNYPLGPFEWLEKVGTGRFEAVRGLVGAR